MNDSDLFRVFVKDMNVLLKSNPDVAPDKQKKLFNELFDFENAFKAVLLQTAYGRDMYKKFVVYITEEVGNILHARPYFRERQNTFSRKMSKAFKTRNSESLHKYRINFLFCDWILSHLDKSQLDRPTYKKQHDKLMFYFDKIKNQRRLLCENNLPLALNRVKIFWHKVPESHLQYVDLIQNSAEGLLIAIDKFTPPYKTVFRTTAIGRMTEGMLTDYNATMLKLPPREKRVLYRYGIAKNRKNLEKDNEVLDFIHESFKGVSQENLNHIVSATSLVLPLDYQTEDGVSLADKLPGDFTPEDHLEKTVNCDTLIAGLMELSIPEYKMICLKMGM